MRYSQVLNRNIMQIPFKYLGMVVGGNPTKQSFWKPVITKIKNKLSTWKGGYLSFAGQICLIKSVITALSLYYFSFYKAPIGVCEIIKNLQRNFLWGWGHEGRKIAWIRWEIICKSKDEGGIGLKDIHLFNKALLAKWKWRLGTEEHGLWKDILESKYGSWSGLRRHTRKHYTSRWWKDLCDVCGEGEEGKWFNQNLEWKVGSGSRIKFWEDTWKGSLPLYIRFPRLYENSISKEKTLREFGEWTNNGWVWLMKWRRDWFEWELPQEDFKQMLNQTQILREGEDLWV